MSKCLLSAFAIVLSLPLMVHADTPTGFDPQKFQQLLDLAGKTGQTLQGPDFTYQVLSQISPPDESQPHKADYFSAIGGFDSNNNFDAIDVAMVSEDWRKRDNGDWEIEQWEWSVATDGNLESVAHDILVENADGLVLSLTGIPTGDISDPAELGRLEAKLEQWYK